MLIWFIPLLLLLFLLDNTVEAKTKALSNAVLSEDKDSWSATGSMSLIKTYDTSHLNVTKSISVHKKAALEPQAGSNNAPLYHYPYRPKFVAHPYFGMCELEDFKFEAKDRLGKGGFGQVFKAVHKSGRQVAIKFISAESIKKQPKHVENEEIILRALRSPFIGELYCTIGGPSNDIFFVLPYFEGDNLAKRLPSMYPLPRHVMVKYVAQIYLALRYMHSQCIMHRDLKAENVMLSRDDIIKVIDVGLSVYDCQNKMSNFAGTLEYVAPEVAARTPYGRAADYYSLAVLVYLLATQSLPYRKGDNSKQEFARKLADGLIIIPSTGDADIDELVALLADRDQAQRWKHANVNYEDFKKLAFFKGFRWDYYEDFSMYNNEF